VYKQDFTVCVSACVHACVHVWWGVGGWMGVVVGWVLSPLANKV